MEYAQIILLGIIQGITEFLPISSSGHLILAPVVFGFPDQGLVLDAILHLASLIAILIFFRNDLLNLFLGLVGHKRGLPYRKLAWSILLASIPAGLAGLFFEDFIATQLRSSTFVAYNLIFWSGVFFIADRQAKKTSTGRDDPNRLTLGQIFFVGCAQAMALLPGTSRSGVTIAAGLFCQMSATAAARFSFLLGTPIILAAGMHKTVEILTSPQAHISQGAGEILVGFLVTFLVGYYSINLLLKIVARMGLLPFIIYRTLLGVAILILFPAN